MGVQNTAHRVSKGQGDPIIIDLQAEIERLNEKHVDGFSTKEMSKSLGKSPSQCRIWIGQLIDNGVVEYAGKRRVKAIDNTTRYIPIYRYIGKV